MLLILPEEQDRNKPVSGQDRCRFCYFEAAQLCKSRNRGGKKKFSHLDWNMMVLFIRNGTQSILHMEKCRRDLKIVLNLGCWLWGSLLIAVQSNNSSFSCGYLSYVITIGRHAKGARSRYSNVRTEGEKTNYVEDGAAKVQDTGKHKGLSLRCGNQYLCNNSSMLMGISVLTEML